MQNENFSIPSSIEWNFKGNKYIVKRATSAQLIDMYKKKSMLTGGFYGSMLSENTFGSNSALDMLDCFCWIEFLCPEFLKNLSGVSNLYELDVIDACEIRDSFQNDVMPWIESWMKVLINYKIKSIEKDKDQKGE